MTCVSDVATFRLLDAYVGWDEDVVVHLRGLDDPGGLTLASTDPAGGVPARDLPALFGSRRLARGCGPCEWYLVTPAACGARLLRRAPCALEFASVWSAGCEYPLVEPVAVAARRHDVAVSDAGAGRVWAWSAGGGVPRASIALDAPGALAFTASGQLVVAVAGTTTVRRFTPSGDPVSTTHIHADGEITDIALATDCALWAAVRDPHGSVRLHRLPHGARWWEEASRERAREDLPPSAVALVVAAGFCLADPSGSGAPLVRCYDWCGAPTDGHDPEGGPELEARGELLTKAIDSGIPGARWHRVRVDADIPPGTGVAVAVAVADLDSRVPHADDWQPAPPGALDILVDQPPGRYLFVRLELTGPGSVTPAVRRVRLDFPRVTSFDHLPAVYRQSPEAQDFGERFLSLFDAPIAELDHVIDRQPALLDVENVPAEMLPWLGTFLELAAEPWWGSDRHRRLLLAAPWLYRRRGTPGALADAVELVFGVRPVITEAAPRRPWGVVGSSRLRAVRLFGRSTSRVRLGSSRLSATPVRSLGNPDLDPLIADAQRFSVLVPAGAVRQPGELDALRRLVAAQAPAHAVGGVRVGGSGFIVGSWSAVGVDTALTPLPAPVLGGGGPGQVRLGRMSVLWPARGGLTGFVPGRDAVVGATTVAR